MNNPTPTDEPRLTEAPEETPVLKTNYKSMAKRYELAERMIWAETPPWKRHVIIECRVTGKEDSLYDDYARSIRILAEDENAKLNEKCPPVPNFYADKKPAVAGA